MKILLIDNYDSFTYNLVHLLKEVSDVDVTVVRNDHINLNTLNDFSHIMLSPGPGIPKEAGLMNEVIRLTVDDKSIFGVCLGHQAIAEHFGGSLINLKKVFHGKEEVIEIDNTSKLFLDLPTQITVGRYHSWVVDSDSLPEVFKVTAKTNDKQIMALEHSALPIFGVQFHPESVMTECGIKIVKNWLSVGDAA
jgi:anthranilate synthase component 2